MTYAQRLRTVQVDGSALQSRSKARYFDDAVVAQSFAVGGTKPMTGKERKELFMDQTHGLGLVKTSKDGTLTRESPGGCRIPLTPKEAKVIAGDNGDS